MKEKLNNIWNRQMYQIKQLSNSSVVFMVELYDSEAKVIASTDILGFDYDVHKTIDLIQFGLDKLSNGSKVVYLNENLTYDFKSLMSVPIHYSENIVWGAIILLSNKTNAYTYEIEQDVKVFSYSITNQIKIYSIENSSSENPEIQIDSALSFFLRSIKGVPWRLNFLTKKFI